MTGEVAMNLSMRTVIEVLTNKSVNAEQCSMHDNIPGRGAISSFASLPFTVDLLSVKKGTAVAACWILSMLHRVTFNVHL